MQRNSTDTGVIILSVIVVITLLIGLARACSPQGLARNWGGDAEIYLEPNRKLVEVTWKDENAWYLTKPMTDEDIAESYEFAESDALGILEGTLHIQETKISSKEYEAYLKWKKSNEAFTYQDYLEEKKQLSQDSSETE